MFQSPDTWLCWLTLLNVSLQFHCQHLAQDLVYNVYIFYRHLQYLEQLGLSALLIGTSTDFPPSQLWDLEQ